MHEQDVWAQYHFSNILVKHQGALEGSGNWREDGGKKTKMDSRVSDGISKHLARQLQLLNDDYNLCKPVSWLFCSPG